MKYLLLFLLCFKAQAALKVAGDEVLPLVNRKYPLKEFIRDYADLMKLNVTYPSNLIPERVTIHLELNTKTTKEEFKKVFYELLSNSGYLPIEDGGILWLSYGRDIRYIPTSVFTDEKFPTNASFSTVVYQLKYPLSAEVARNLRPFMSRYGRVIDLSDSKTLIINDRGDNIARLIATMQNMDTEAAYKSVLDYKPKVEEEKDQDPLREKIVELELEKKILEKKLLQDRGNGSGVVREGEEF
jgi:type II secretory pathway component GspD/PulD (secretin)